MEGLEFRWIYWDMTSVSERSYAGTFCFSFMEVRRCGLDAAIQSVLQQRIYSLSFRSRYPECYLYLPARRCPTNLISV